MITYYTPPSSLYLSPQNIDKIRSYQRELIFWNKQINLISKTGLINFHRKHIDDCFGLLPFLPSQSCTIADLGSGAGLPGILLTIVSNHQLILVEVQYKKSVFLSHIAHLCQLSCSIINQRIENLEREQFDIVTARALSNLSQLWNWTKPLLKKNGFGLFIKSNTNKTKQEINQFKRYNSTCSLTIHNHPYNYGKILIIHK